MAAVFGAELSGAIGSYRESGCGLIGGEERGADRRRQAQMAAAGLGRKKVQGPKGKVEGRKTRVQSTESKVQSRRARVQDSKSRLGAVKSQLVEVSRRGAEKSTVQGPKYETEEKENF